MPLMCEAWIIGYSVFSELMDPEFEFLFTLLCLTVLLEYVWIGGRAV